MLSDVEFHTGVADPVAFACRLLRKACRQGARLLVTAPPPRLAELDRSLWTFDARDFLPHLCRPALQGRGAASASQAARTPLWLAATVADAGGGAPSVLLNLGADAPPDLHAWQRVIEVVGTDVDEARAGRERWRAYRSAGLRITHHGAAVARE